MNKNLDIIFGCIILLLNQASSKNIIADSSIYNKVASCLIPLYYYCGSASYIEEFVMPTGVYKRTEEHKQKISEAHKGMKCTQETRNKISKECQKRKERNGYINSLETRKKISKTLMGRKRSQEECNNISKGRLKLKEK